jgi:lysozyme
MYYFDDILISELILDEGFELKSYSDTKGNWTIGIGHLLGKNPAFSNIIWTPQKVIVTFIQDINSSIYHVRNQVSTFDYWNDNRKRVLVNMMFNMGPRTFSGFNEMKKGLNNQDVRKVYNEMLDSKWAKIDVPPRAKRLADRWLNG